jgi:hypothetical protein
MGFPCIGLPGTIDNDIKGTDYTIGFFTALSTVVEAIDRLRDTSSSHQRISVVEVMGRYCGDLTLAAAIAGGCEFIMVPEVEYTRDDLVAEIKAGIAKGKNTLSWPSPSICATLTSWRTTSRKKPAVKPVPPYWATFSAAVLRFLMTVFWHPAWARTLLNCCCRAWRPLRRYSEREAGSPRHHRRYRKHEASVQKRLAGLREETVLSSGGKKKAFSEKAFFMGGTLLDIQGIFGKDNPGIIGIEMVAGEEGHAAEIDAHVAFADTFTCGPDRNGRQRLNADIQLFQVVNLTHRAIDHNPSHSFCTARRARSASINARRTEPPPSTSRI